jgi:hypothetical protein
MRCSVGERLPVLRQQDERGHEVPNRIRHVGDHANPALRRRVSRVNNAATHPLAKGNAIAITEIVCNSIRFLYQGLRGSNLFAQQYCECNDGGRVISKKSKRS